MMLAVGPFWPTASFFIRSFKKSGLLLATGWRYRQECLHPDYKIGQDEDIQRQIERLITSAAGAKISSNRSPGSGSKICLSTRTKSQVITAPRISSALLKKRIVRIDNLFAHLGTDYGITLLL